MDLVLLGGRRAEKDCRSSEHVLVQHYMVDGTNEENMRIKVVKVELLKHSLYDKCLNLIPSRWRTPMKPEKLKIAIRIYSSCMHDSNEGTRTK